MKEREDYHCTLRKGQSKQGSLTCSPAPPPLKLSERQGGVRKRTSSGNLENTIRIWSCSNRSWKWDLTNPCRLKELELKSSIPTHMWPKTICLSVWFLASCHLILFENLTKGVVAATMSVGWPLWTLTTFRFYFLFAEWRSWWII